VSDEGVSRAIRQATSGDAPSIRACVRAAYAVYERRLDRPPAPLSADVESEIDRGLVYLLEEQGETRGLIVLIEDGEGLLVENVAVAPEHQGRGLGRQLLSFAEAHARQHGLKAVHLYTNALMTENIELYRGLGFEETGRRRDDGYDRVFMRKLLAGEDGQR
jgi:ribosomal protein S18 acetylase RimI-like enzyme